MEVAAHGNEVWIVSGVRTPFAKVDGPLGTLDAIGLSVPVVRHMIDQLHGAVPDFAVWGTVVPNLTWSNIAREVLMDAGVAPTIPAFSTVMACSTSMIGVDRSGRHDRMASIATLRWSAGSESMSRVQLGLGQSLSDWLRKFQQARSLGQKIAHVTDLEARRHQALHSRRLPIARPARAWASTPKSPPRNGSVAREAQDQDRAATVTSAPSPHGIAASSTIWSSRSAICGATPSHARIPRSRSSRSCRRPSTEPAAMAR